MGRLKKPATVLPGSGWKSPVGRASDAFSPPGDLDFWTEIVDPRRASK